MFGKIILHSDMYSTKNFFNFKYNHNAKKLDLILTHKTFLFLVEWHTKVKTLIHATNTSSHFPPIKMLLFSFPFLIKKIFKLRYTWQSPGERNATHSHILAGKIPRIQSLAGYSSRVGYWTTKVLGIQHFISLMIRFFQVFRETTLKVK